jgi:hypothetical protein
LKLGELFEKILENNKENINFIFVHEQAGNNYGNKYADFINKYYDVDEIDSIKCQFQFILS